VVNMMMKPNFDQRTTSAIIVAAGNSRRMGFDKLAAPLLGRTVLQRTIDAFDACALVDSIIVVGGEGHPMIIRIIGAIALFASMTNIVSGFLITDRMLKMFKSPGEGGKR